MGNPLVNYAIISYGEIVKHTVVYFMYLCALVVLEVPMFAFVCKQNGGS